MRRGGVTIQCIVFALFAAGQGSTAYGHHFGQHSSSYWMGGYLFSGYPYGGWGPYGATPLVTGMTVFPQAGAGFGGMGPVVGAGPMMGGGVGGGGGPGVNLIPAAGGGG